MEEDWKKKDEKDQTEIYLSEWQTCVEMVNTASQRRDVMNGLFVTVNLAIIAAISIVWDIKSLCMSIAGFFICIIWMLLIWSYRRLNKAKYEVIYELENKLPYMPYKREWAVLKERHKHYLAETKIEIGLSCIFLIGYIAISIIICILGE
ncbi:MAG: hypothetical protein LUE27_04715 [Clostridia bacterium]|nr:hypothetical protein [Clostridia bacterium]